MSRNLQNYNIRVQQNREENIPPPITLDDIGKDDIGIFDYIGQALADNSPSILTTFIPGLTAIAGATRVAGAARFYKHLELVKVVRCFMVTLKRYDLQLKLIEKLYKHKKLMDYMLCVLLLVYFLQVNLEVK